MVGADVVDSVYSPHDRHDTDYANVRQEQEDDRAMDVLSEVPVSAEPRIKAAIARCGSCGATSLAKHQAEHTHYQRDCETENPVILVVIETSFVEDSVRVVSIFLVVSIICCLVPFLQVIGWIDRGEANQSSGLRNLGCSTEIFGALVSCLLTLFFRALVVVSTHPVTAFGRGAETALEHPFPIPLGNQKSGTEALY